MNDPPPSSASTPSKKGLPWFATLVIALIGTIFLGVGLFMGRKALSFTQDVANANGVVVRLVHHAAKRHNSTKPVVKYAVDGRDFEITGEVGSNMPRYHVGDRVQILYRPNNPADAVIDTFVERWLFPVIFGGIGAVLSLIGWGALVWKLVSRVTPRRFDENERFTIE